MKKLIAILIAALCLMSALTLSVSADNADTFSEDLKTAYFKGDVYYAFDETFIDEFPDGEYTAQLTEAQRAKYVSASLTANHNLTVLWGTFKEQDGATLSVTYMRGDLFAQYKNTVKGDVDKVYVDSYFGYNYYEVNFETLTRTPCKLRTSDYWNYYYVLNVTAPIGDEELYLRLGEVVCIDNEYYYIEYASLGSDYAGNWPEEFDAYLVDDPETLGIFAEATEATDLGINFDSIADISTASVLILLFFIVPGAVLIFSFIMIFVSKKRPYKSRYIKVTLLSAFEILLFLGIAAIVIINHFI